MERKALVCIGRSLKRQQQARPSRNLVDKNAASLIYSWERMCHWALSEPPCAVPQWGQGVPQGLGAPLTPKSPSGDHDAAEELRAGRCSFAHFPMQQSQHPWEAPPAGTV